MRWLVLAALLAVACDQTSAGARDNYLRSEQDAFVFHASHAAILARARMVLAENGYALDVGDATARDLTTAAKPDGDGTAVVAVHVIDLADGRHLLRLFEIRRDARGQVTGPYNPLRRDDWEWEVAEQLEPDRTVTIVDRARKLGEDVHRTSGR